MSGSAPKGANWPQMVQMLNVQRSVSKYFGSQGLNEILKLILNGPIFVPFGINLTKFGTDPDIPVARKRILIENEITEIQSEVAALAAIALFDYT